MSKSTLTQVTLLLDRDATNKLPVVVYDYEQPILEELYGEEQVIHIEEKEVEVEGFDVQAAFDGLKGKYRNPEASAALKQIYPNVRDLAKRLGIKAAAGEDTKPAKAGKAAAGDK